MEFTVIFCDSIGQLSLDGHSNSSCTAIIKGKAIIFDAMWSLPINIQALPAVPRAPFAFSGSQLLAKNAVGQKNIYTQKGHTL